MSFGNTTENDLMKLIYNSVALSWAATTDLWVSLHTSNPDEGGSQTTNEASYTGYARVAIDRSTDAELTVTANSVANALLVQFAECTAGSAAVTHFAFGTASSGAGQVIHKGALAATLNIAAGIQPQFNAGALTATLD